MISDRARLLLKHLIELYLENGQPVGSKTLAGSAVLQLSPATVRKVLGDLESQGYILSPHTSAGRVPTTQGIRFFVDSLLTVHPLEQAKINAMHAKLDEFDSVDNLISQTSSVLSELTHLVGVVTLPQHTQQPLRHVEFLPLADNRVLVILVLNEQQVQNRIIVTERQFSQSELQQVSNFLNTHFVGKDLYLARKELLSWLEKDRLSMDALMKAVVEVANVAFMPEKKSPDYIMAGQQHLFNNPHARVEDLQKVFEAFTQKQAILQIVDQCLNTDGVQIYIGEESGNEAFREYSLITSRYTVNGENIGVLGVIGPRRMPYNQVIPTVELTAKMLGQLLNS